MKIRIKYHLLLADLFYIISKHFIKLSEIENYKVKVMLDFNK